MESSGWTYARPHLLAHLPISERSVTNLLDRYDELVALTVLDPQRLQALTAATGRVVLALDGIQPDEGHEVLWVVQDCLSGEILLARSLLSATTEDLAALLQEVRDALPVPITGVISDGQHPIRRAVARVLPDVPHQLCQFHYLREAAKPVFDADRHAKLVFNCTSLPTDQYHHDVLLPNTAIISLIL
ncbi:MAG: hypothetical protein KatS3mg057_2654 [Herpetosiphonaceae bacterium]|nr:MAG: hypothetical protein KatS3mg057_2654 [Herpetosiphonaceae bacterium]